MDQLSECREKLTPDATFPAGVRFGAYLRCVPVQNRIGDYVHCTGRVVNIMLKRILTHFPDPRVTNTVKDIISRLTLESQGIPVQDTRVLLLSS